MPWGNHINNNNGNKLYKNDLQLYYTDEPTRYGRLGQEPSTIDLLVTKGITAHNYTA